MKSSLLMFSLSVILAIAAPTRADDYGSPPPVIRDFRVGTCTHFEDWGLGVLPAISQSGLGWVRDGVEWKSIESSNGVYHVPAKTMQWIDAVHAAGLHIIFILNMSNDLYADHYDPVAYSKAAAYLAKELAGKVQALEIENEPANFGYRAYYGGTWNGVEQDGTVSPWVGKYVILLNTAAKAIKQANPSMKVIGLGSVTPVNFRQIEKGIAPEVDGIVDHPYSFRLVAEQVPFSSNDAIAKRDGIVTADAQGNFSSQIGLYRSLSQKQAGPPEIWLTEWGWTTYNEAASGSLYGGFTELAQAKYILRRYIESIALSVDVSVQYDFKDDGTNPFDPEHHFGLVHTDLSPKPAYGAVQRLTTLMASYKPRQVDQIDCFPLTSRQDPRPSAFDGAVFSAPGNIRCYEFADARQTPLVVLWSAERAGSDENPRRADIEITPRTPFHQITSYDFLTGVSTNVSFEVHGARMILKKFPVSDSPVALTFK
jgi:hypothetical protein